MNLWLGDLFKKLSRYFYSKCTGVCWNCGSRCGMNSTMARGLLWCNHCYQRWEHPINDVDYVFDKWNFGKVIKHG